MKNKNTLIVLIIFLFSVPLIAQDKYTFTQFADESGDFIKQPLNWETSDFLKIGMISACTGLVMFTDQPVRDAVKRDQRYYKSVPIEFGRMWGELYSSGAIFSGLAVYSLLTDNLKARKIAYEIGQAMIYAGAINYLMKVAAGRARPYTDKGSGTYRPFYSLIDDKIHSFPSGHSTAAFTLSTVLAKNVESVWLKVLFYSPAALTMISRVYQDQHWTSDTFLGAALGYFIASWVVDKHERVNDKINNSSENNIYNRIMLQPFTNGEIIGISLSLKLY